MEFVLFFLVIDSIIVATPEYIAYCHTLCYVLNLILNRFCQDKKRAARFDLNLKMF